MNPLSEKVGRHLAKREQSAIELALQSTAINRRTFQNQELIESMIVYVTRIGFENGAIAFKEATEKICKKEEF